MVVKILEDRSEGCEIHIHCQSREDEEVKQLIFLLEANRKRIPASCQRQTFLLKPSQILYAEAVEGSVFLYTADQVYTSPLFPEFSGKRIWRGRLFPLRKKRVGEPAADRTAAEPAGRSASAHLFQRRENTGKPALCGDPAPPSGRNNLTGGKR